jgi:hypothetical protein
VDNLWITCGQLVDKVYDVRINRAGERALRIGSIFYAEKTYGFSGLLPRPEKPAVGLRAERPLGVIHRLYSLYPPLIHRLSTG